MHELVTTLGIPIRWTERPEQALACCQMFIYLTEMTWEEGGSRHAFAAEVKTLLDAGMPLLLAYEAPGFDGGAVACQSLAHHESSRPIVIRNGSS